MSNITSNITSNIDRKIKIFIEALSDQLSIEKEELYEIFNNLVETGSETSEAAVVEDEEDLEDPSDSSEEKEEQEEKEEVKTEVKKVGKVDKKVDKKSKSEKSKCEYVLTKGANKGQTCGVSTESGKFCKKHAGSEKKEEVAPVVAPVVASVPAKEVKETKPVELKQAATKGKCEYLLSKGKNAGQKCNANTEGSNYCKKHSKDAKEEEKTETKKEAKKESPAKKTAKNKKVDDEQKDKETINRLVDNNTKEKSEKVVKKGEPVLSLSRNRFGNFEMPETGFVFDPKTRQVVGTQNDNGSIDDLTVEDIALCKEFGFNNVKIPEKLKSSVSDSEDLEEEDLDEEELEDEDDEEDFDEDDEEEDD